MEDEDLVLKIKQAEELVVQQKQQEEEEKEQKQLQFDEQLIANLSIGSKAGSAPGKKNASANKDKTPPTKYPASASPFGAKKDKSSLKQVGGSVAAYGGAKPAASSKK